MSAADAAAPVSSAEADALFAPLAGAPALILAVSGGPDSTALLMLAARWRSSLKTGPKLLAVTVDHGLRTESAAEAAAVRRQARRLAVPHRVVRWQGKKPASGLQAAARRARYELLASSARHMKARHILTAHTLDDQAETVLLRMSRGSGLSGLAAMARVTPLTSVECLDLHSRDASCAASEPHGRQAAVGRDHEPLLLVRPLLEIPKTRLVATLMNAGIEFADDPSNRDPRFTRARIRQLMPALAREGLDAHRLALLAKRLRRADEALETAVDEATATLCARPWSVRGGLVLDAKAFLQLPGEVGVRLLGRAIMRRGHGGPARLGKLETLYELLADAYSRGLRQSTRVRRTLAGALVTLTATTLTIDRAPARSRLDHR